MSKRTLKLSLIMFILLLVLMPCFALAEDAVETDAAEDVVVEDASAENTSAEDASAEEETEAESVPVHRFDPQDPSVPAMDEPCGENGIPVLYLTIAPDEFDKVWRSGDHSYRAPGKIRIVVPDGYKGEYGGTLTPDTGELDLEYIRGRGHSTWRGPKRPFRMKLDKKADLLGMGKNKHWVLLANAFDAAMLRNRITGYIGERMGLEYTPKSQPVDLVVNGTYRGSYTLCENVRIDSNRIDIDEINPGDVNQPEITGGYLLELSPGTGDPYVEITTDHDVYIGVNTPEFAEYSDQEAPGRDAQSRYIFDYIRNLEDAIYAEDFSDPAGVRYSDYMDIESAAKYWWVQEFSVNGDGFVTSSTYLYKKRNGKLYWGPLWDFDLSYSNPDTETVFNNTQMPWLDHMRAYDPEYQKVLREEWNTLDQILKDITKKGGVLDSYADEIRSSWKNDKVAYERVYEQEDPSYEAAEAEFREEIEKLRNFIDSRRAAINESIDRDLYKVFCTLTFMEGDEILKADEIRIGAWLGREDYPEMPDREDSVFEGWYTDAECTDAFDEYSAVTEDTVLYAKWSSEEDGSSTEPDGDEEDEGSGEDQSSAAQPGKPGSGPETGDDTGLAARVILMLGSAFALAVIGFKRRSLR